MNVEISEDYAWPACAACSKNLWVSEEGRLTCRPCEDRTRQRLHELVSLFAQLNRTATLMRGARTSGAATSGSKAPPIPPRLDVLALTAAGGLADRLQAIEDSWRQALGWATPPTVDQRTTFPVNRDGAGRQHVGQPVKADRVYPHWRTSSAAAAVPERVKFLLNNLPWACDDYASVGQDIDDIRRLHAECTAAVSGERKPGRVPIGVCPVELEDGPCRDQLTASPADHRVECGNCGARWEGLGEWQQLRLAQAAVLQGDAIGDVAAAA